MRAIFGAWSQRDCSVGWQRLALESEPARIERRAERGEGGGARFCYLDDLRLVLTAGVPGPWGEAANGLFHLKKIPYVAVAHAALQIPALADSPAGDSVRRLGAKYGHSPETAAGGPVPS